MAELKPSNLTDIIVSKIQRVDQAQVKMMLDLMRIAQLVQPDQEETVAKPML